MQDCPVLTEYLRLREECRRLVALSQTDPLTGLYNRHYLWEALSREMERTRRTGAATGLIMLDLDHFKRLNDTFGHQYGDAVLQAVGRFLQRSVRTLDIPCRYGGEEFALILPGARLIQALRLAERLRVALPDAVAGDARALPLSASFGVAAYNHRDDLTSEGFVHLADTALLEAKSRGRNLVCCPGSGADSADPEVGAAERSALFTPKQSSTSPPRCRP
jgi:diguanylate cyclase (GGDEF)-like protein